MAYVYAKNQECVKKKLRKHGFVANRISRTAKKYELNGLKRYYVTFRKKKR